MIRDNCFIMMRKVYFIVFAVLCLLSCIVPAMAVYNIGYLDAVGHSYDAGTINGNSLEISFAYAQYVRPTDQWYQPVNNVNINGIVYYLDGYQNMYSSQSDIPKNTITLSAYQEGQNTFTITPNTWADPSTITVNFVYTQEPPTPEGAYLTATVLSESYTGTMYEIQTHSTTATIFTGWFSEITTTPQTYRPMFTPFEKERTLIYKVPTGETITFYSLYVNLPGIPEEAQQVSITVTETGLNPDEIINQTSPEIQPNNTAYNPPPIPQVTPGSNNNPINSGKFKPSNNNYVTPFTEFIDNAKTITRLPTMTDPQILKTEVLNGTGNITAPLYNTIDGFTTLLIFPAVTASNNIQLLLQPLEEMLQYCDAVMVEIFKTVNNFFVTIYPLRDFFYMLIPDFVWWIMAALLVFEIVVTIMTFVYGRGVTWYYLFGFGEHDKK